MLPRRFLRPWPETLQESLRIQFFRHGFTQQRGISQRLRYAGSGGEGSEKRRLLQCTTIRRRIIRRRRGTRSSLCWISWSMTWEKSTDGRSFCALSSIEASPKDRPSVDFSQVIDQLI